MQKGASAARVHSFPVRHPGSELNSVFTQEGKFIPDADGRFVAPFSCFPVARGRMVLTGEAVREFENLADGTSVEDALVDAIKKKLPTATNGQLVIERGDLKTGVPPRKRSTPQP